MASDPKPSSSENKNVSINGDVSGVVVVGDKNVVNNQTIIQKFFNIFKSDSETLEHRNRRILLGHVENAWIKGVLDASLHGAALLDLGINQDPEAVTKYPWTIKKESTKETLPVGTSMLEIFDSIGMGRSLLILGAPGSGKTTMLLELACGLIARAREDVTYPIPMVFNLASWTEKLTLADWLAQELNNLYSVPRKTAPDWVQANKLLLLLDGLDEVRQESRAKCVEAINAFRKEHGLTSLAVCSRSQDYEDTNTKLSFEGAIEFQPLTQKQITEFFNRFGNEMAGIKQVLKKDTALREMAETPLFLSIILMAYRDKRDVDILVSQDEKAQRKHLFDTYIERMFERSKRSSNIRFNKANILRGLTWLSRNMVRFNISNYQIETTQPSWLEGKSQLYLYRLIIAIIFALIGSLFGGVLSMTAIILLFGQATKLDVAVDFSVMMGVIFGLFGGLLGGLQGELTSKIITIDKINLSWKAFSGRLIFGLLAGSITWLIYGPIPGISAGLIGGPITGVIYGLRVERIEKITSPGQRLKRTFFNTIFVTMLGGLGLGLIAWLDGGIRASFILVLFFGLNGAFGIILQGVLTIIEHFSLRLVMKKYGLSSWRLIPFLDHCVDLIFLRRVGGGYIFVHRLLMEHFAEMYVETTK